MSWSDTQIVATVASHSISGKVQVLQGGVWSNTVPFTVNTATISSVVPASGVPGTQVTITGTFFGSTQGSSQIWLGSTAGVVQSWNDTQIVAQVAAGATSAGGVRILQNGVLSPATPFTVNTLRIASLSPTSGVAGTSVTFTGAGFGSSQGSGTVWLGSTAGIVVSWSDTQVVAAVASSAVTGIARIQQNGVWSNAEGFIVPVAGGNSVMPSMVNMVVGDTRTLQALSATGQPVTGLTWTSSNTAVVSLSTDDPPVLTALAAGHATVRAGSASADVTVSAGVLATGTVIWSNPGNGSGVYSIVPAVPSASGVADVFAFQDDGTVQAITSDGTTAWTADVSQAQYALPDFQGSLVVMNKDSNNKTSIMKLNGTTGQAYPAYTGDGTWGVKDYLNNWSSPVQAMSVHPDGTIFAIVADLSSNGLAPPDRVIGIDPITGTQKFSVPLPLQRNWGDDMREYGIIIAGDGYAYVPWAYRDSSSHLMLLRINSSGAYDNIKIYDCSWGYDFMPIYSVNLITNADQGVLLSWEDDQDSSELEASVWEARMAMTTGTSVSLVPGIAGQDTAVVPVLQAQDGSFVGTVGTGPVWPNPGFDKPQHNMVAFDASGNVKWMVAGKYEPQIATADGGVIATLEDGTAVTFDQNGNATGQMASLPIQSWRGNIYQQGSVDQVAFLPVLVALSLWADQGGGPSGNLTAGRPWYFRLSFQNGFTFTPVYPNVLTNLTTDITSSAPLIKRHALQAVRDAYSGVPVTVFEGDHGGDALAEVRNDDSEVPPGCGVTNYNSLLSEVGYIRNMQETQDALQIVINNALDESAALANQGLIQAIGRGLGNIAAHEIAHQFLGLCCTMDANPQTDVNARGTFNATGCSGRTDPSPYTGYWPTPKILLHWEQTALDALGTCLGGGWRDRSGKACHN